MLLYALNYCALINMIIFFIALIKSRINVVVKPNNSQEKNVLTGCLQNNKITGMALSLGPPFFVLFSLLRKCDTTHHFALI